jgi:peptide-methionine (S)-S-oxide reductase
MKTGNNEIIPATTDMIFSEISGTATFAMGCFWRPDALFGSLEGVVRTRVGYAGGSTKNPTYWNLADHIETIQLDYDPAKTRYQDLLTIFFDNHKPIAEPWKRQYMSAVFCHNEEQAQLIEQLKEKISRQLNLKIVTAVYPYQEFYLAEGRHQKYKLQRQPELMKELSIIYPDFDDMINSTAAARINGYLHGYGNQEVLGPIMDRLHLSPAAREIILGKGKGLKAEYHCSCG